MRVAGIARPGRALLARSFGVLVSDLILVLARFSGRKAGVALMYHGVAERVGDSARYVVPPVDAEAFEAQIRYLARRHRLVRASELRSAVGARARGQRFPVAITFDDDLPSHIAIALPVLRRWRAPATFFLTGSSLDGPFSFWWERLQLGLECGTVSLDEISARLGLDSLGLREIAKRIEVLPRQEKARLAEWLVERMGGELEGAGLRRDGVREIVRSGSEIGFHTRDHEPLTLLDDADLADALRTGRSELASEVGRELETIAYPHGKVDARVAAAARAAAFSYGFTTAPESMDVTTDPLLVGRLDPSWMRSRGQFALNIVCRLVGLR